MNQHMDDVLSSLSEGVLIIDRDYTIIYANERVTELYGNPDVGIIGKKCHAVFHGSLMPCEDGALCSHREVFTKGQPVTLRHQQLLPDGSTRIIEISAAPLRDEKGTVDRFVEVLRDITEEEKLRQELAASHQTLEAIFINAPFAISFIDKEMRVIRLNPTMEALVGFKTEEARARHCYDCWGQYAHDTNRCGRERICDVCQVSLAWLDGEKHSYERRVGDRVIEVITSPVRDGDCAIIGAMEIGNDITERKRVEEHLRAVSQRLDMLLSSTPAVIYSCGISGDFGATFVSDNVKNRLGFEPYEFTEDPGFWADHIHPEDRERVIAGLGRLFETGCHNHEYRFRHQNGLYRWMYDECKLILDDSGKPVEIVGYWVDITERHRARLALEQSEQRFRTILDSATDAIFAADRNARIVDVNRRATLSLGYSREELLRMGIEDIDPDFSLQWRREAVWDRISPGETITIERRHRRKDGSIFPVEIHMGKVLLDGDPVVLSLARDVSERVRDKQALLESENSYRALFESSPNILCIADFSGIRQYLAELAPGCAGDHETFFRENSRELGACLSRLRISKANQAALDCFGAASQQELIEGLFTIIGPETAVQTVGGISAIGRGESFFEHEIVLHHLLTGARIYCILRWNVVPGYEAGYQRVILSLTDISARKNAEDKLAAHRAQLRNLSTRLVETEEGERRRLAGELHDKLGQHLTALGLNLNILEQSLPASGQVPAHRGRIADMSRLMEEMTEQVRDIMADLRPPVLDDYGLGAALRWYGKIFSMRTGIVVMVSGSEPPRFLVALELALFRVAQEALTNAAKHSGASEVEIYCHVDDSRHLTMEITDNGKGFSVGGNVINGSGFGLISMRERVQAFGGTLQIDSQSGGGVSVVVEVEI